MRMGKLRRYGQNHVDAQIGLRHSVMLEGRMAHGEGSTVKSGKRSSPMSRSQRSHNVGRKVDNVLKKALRSPGDQGHAVQLDFAILYNMDEVEEGCTCWISPLQDKTSVRLRHMELVMG